MSATTDSLLQSLAALIRTNGNTPASDVRAYEAQVIAAIGMLEARARGSRFIYSDSGAPPDADGLEGDLGLNRTNGDVYEFRDGQFIFLFNLFQKVLTEPIVGVTDHGKLSGLADDDHKQYYNATRLNALKGAADGLASLDANGLVPASQLPSFVDDVLDSYPTLAALQAAVPTGETGKIYVTTNDGAQYRWTGSVYSKLSDSGLTAAQKAAISNAVNPTATNPFATIGQLVVFQNSQGSIYTQFNTVTKHYSVALGGELSRTGAELAVVLGGSNLQANGIASVAIGAGFSTAVAQNSFVYSSRVVTVNARNSGAVGGENFSLAATNENVVAIGVMGYTPDPALTNTTIVRNLLVHENGGGITFFSPNGQVAQTMRLQNDGTFNVVGGGVPANGSITPEKLDREYVEEGTLAESTAPQRDTIIETMFANPAALVSVLEPNAALRGDSFLHVRNAAEYEIRCTKELDGRYAWKAIALQTKPLAAAGGGQVVERYSMMANNDIHYVEAVFGKGRRDGSAQTSVPVVTAPTFTVELFVSLAEAASEGHRSTLLAQEGCFRISAPANQLRVLVGTDTPTGQDNGVELQTSVLIDTHIKRVALICTPTTIAVAVDGAVVASTTDRPQYFNFSEPLRLGSAYQSAGEGVSDEIAVFNLAKSAADTVPSAPYAGNEAGLLAVYHLNEDVKGYGPAA